MTRSDCVVGARLRPRLLLPAWVVLRGVAALSVAVVVEAVRRVVEVVVEVLVAATKARLVRSGLSSG
jgi:hypothetical protein